MAHNRDEPKAKRPGDLEEGNAAYSGVYGADKDQVVEGFGSSFNERAIRSAFIKKVYAIIFTQLAVTAAIIAIFAYTPDIRLFYRTSSGGFTLYIVSYVVFVVTYIAIVCCESVRRKYPANLITMSIFTLALSFMCGSIACFNDANWIMIAMGITAALCLILTAFAFQTKYDFTGWGFYLYGILWSIIIFGILALVFWQTGYPIIRSVYCGLIALIFSMFLIYDTQRIMGGKKYSISPEEHVVAAVQIYVDIVQIFLAIVGLGRN